VSTRLKLDNATTALLRAAHDRGRALSDARHSGDLDGPGRLDLDTMCSRYYQAHEARRSEHNAQVRPVLAALIELRDSQGGTD
jgi:hypothetical protein